MEEEIKEEERSADEAGKDGNAVVLDMDNLWVKYMEAKLAFKSKRCQPSHPFTICRVPRDIRGVDSVAHDPMVVSIGPYHRGNQSLLDMEQVKWRNLNAYRARKEFNEYLKAMKEVEPRARDCYSGNVHMEADEFIEMMLLDGLFMIELFSTKGEPFLLSLLRQLFDTDEEESIYTISGMLSRVGLDMLLLENQLPFFVLERLWRLSNDQRSRFDLWENACNFMVDYALGLEHEWDLNLPLENFGKEEEKGGNPEMINEDDVHHLLHLVYLLLNPTSLTSTKKSKPRELEPTDGSSSESMKPTAKLPAFIMKTKTLSFLPPRCRDCFPSPSGQESQSMKCTLKLPAFIRKMKTHSFLRPICRSSPSPSGQCTAVLPAVLKNSLLCLCPSMSKDKKPPPPTVIPSAVELHEAGVVFKCVEAKSFLDVEFEQGTMKMPRLSVVDSTKRLFRNFIAYEQCFPRQGNHITSYCKFMDQLVNTQRDVEILKKSGIIENWLGCDEEVALLFNDLCKGTFLSSFKLCYLGKTLEQVTDHTKKTWPKWRAKLMHDYFSNPWAIISLIAATFVIFLTAVQTYDAVFT